jgi:succinoglycan biosynthesis transport protein ExoP
MNDASEVKLHFLDYWRVIKVRSGLITLAFLLVMVTAGVTTYFLPREYFSKATIEVKQDKSGPIDVFNTATRVGNDPTFIPTQFQILEKTEILYPVLENLKLIDAWSTEGRRMQKQTAFIKLTKMLNVREVRNTGLIEIGCYSINADEAANIANSVVVVYMDKREKLLAGAVGRGLAQLNEEVEKQRKRVEEAKAEVEKIRLRDQINDPNTESFDSAPMTADRNLAELEKQANEQQFLVSKLKGQLEEIMKMKPQQLKEVMRTLKIEDPIMEKMIASFNEAESDDAKLTNAGLGENHPKILGLRAAMAVFARQLAESLATVQQSRATNLQIEESVLADLREKVEAAKAVQIGDKNKLGPYLDAKTRYLQAKKVSEAAEVKYSAERLEQGIGFDPAKIWEKAEPSLYPAKPNVPAYMALAALVGLIIGIGLAFFIEYLDTSVKTLDDVEKYLEVPVLAVIPKDVSILMQTPGDTPDAEAYRILRANVEFNKPDRNANTFTLVSGGPGEGKSTTLNNLAYTCARGGYNVLVVDADLRRPTQQKFFDQDNSFGLTDYLTGKATIDEITKTTKIDNLSFIPSGLVSGEAVGILNSQRMVDLIRKVKQQYDLVFFDSPPILGVSDGSVLASECDVTIMVVQHRRFPRAMLQRVKQAVMHAGGTLIGVVHGTTTGTRITITTPITTPRPRPSQSRLPASSQSRLPCQHVPVSITAIIERGGRMRAFVLGPVPRVLIQTALSGLTRRY